MNKLFKWMSSLIVGMVGSFVTYKVYELWNDWSFTIAFLGGGVTMLVAALIHKK